jgi:hypothetical protein
MTIANRPQSAGGVFRVSVIRAAASLGKPPDSQRVRLGLCRHSVCSLTRFSIPFDRTNFNQNSVYTKFRPLKPEHFHSIAIVWKILSNLAIASLSPCGAHEEIIIERLAAKRIDG